MLKPGTILIAAMLLSCAASPAVAAEAEAVVSDAAAAPRGLLPIPEYRSDFFASAPYLTGGWGNDLRGELARKGFQLNVDWTQYGQGVVDGGRDRSTRYGGHADYLVRLDLQRMGVLPGAIVTVRGESRYGHSVNGIAGPILPVNTMALFPLTDELDDDLAIAVTELNLTQFLSEHWAVVFGKLQTLDADLNEFASGRGKSQFMDANFLFNPVAALRLPYSTLGAGVVWLPSHYVKVSAVLVNTVDASTTTGFDDFGDGNTATVEANFQYRLGDLPGGMVVGGLYSFDQEFANVTGRLVFERGEGLSLASEDDTWALYWSAWQYLFVDDNQDKATRPLDTANGYPDLRGFGLFARLGVADDDTNPIKWSASVGVGGRGLIPIPMRANDMFGVGYFYTRFDDDTIFTGLLGLDDHAHGFEAFYNLAITPAIQLTFDVQVHDTALPDTDTAVVLGARLNLRF